MIIEKYLVLNKYLLSLFGVSDFGELQEKLKDSKVGPDSDGRSHFENVLRSSLERLQKDKLPERTLLEYDRNIRYYLKRIDSNSALAVVQTPLVTLSKWSRVTVIIPMTVFLWFLYAGFVKAVFLQYYQ